MPNKMIHFTKQLLMRKVLLSLLPIIIFSVWLFGWRSLALIAISTLSGIITEWLFKRKGNKPVSEAVLVSGVLFSLTLPPTTPFWVAALGMVFGIVFGKEVFGGFGRNVFNPALVARAFVYVNFPTFLTINWTQPATGFPGGLALWLAPKADAVSGATPMLHYRATGIPSAMLDSFLGIIPGSLGETSGLLILLAAAYLIYTKTASWQTMVSTGAGFALFTFLFRSFGLVQVQPLVTGLLSGGFLFGAVFMATDPISSPKSVEGKIIYGILIGGLTVVIRGFALFAGGMMFAILISNTFTPIIEEGVRAWKKSPSEKKEAAQ